MENELSCDVPEPSLYVNIIKPCGSRLQPDYCTKMQGTHCQCQSRRPAVKADYLAVTRITINDANDGDVEAKFTSIT